VSTAVVPTSQADLKDQEWLDRQVEAIETGVEAVVNIARNWTDLRCLSRLHPGVSAAEYVTARVGTLGKSVVPVLLAESNWSNRQIAAVAGVSHQTVARVAQVVQMDHVRKPALGADGKTYPPRIVEAVVIDTPIEEEAVAVDPGTSWDMGAKRNQNIAKARRDRIANGLAVMEGAAREMAGLDLGLVLAVATEEELQAWLRQIASVTASLRSVSRGLRAGRSR
jgi:hypothetical protein